jgi:hypothetical protein
LHFGHRNLLERVHGLGDELIHGEGISTINLSKMEQFLAVDCSVSTGPR